jgi:MFS transporter, DHA2 family, multidrug resistance protein
VDLRVLRERSVAVGTFLTFILGFGMYSSLFIFPVFVQGLLGFTALQTGVVLLADGLACAVAMLVVGKLIEARVSKRLLAGIGFLMFAVACWSLSMSTLESGRGDFVLPLVWRGVGLAMMFVPVMTLALVGLKGPDIAQGSGLTNMMRQLGGSFGVALITTFVQRRLWNHRSGLLEHLSPYDAPARLRVEALTQGLVAHGATPVAAQRQAYAALEWTVGRQTYLMSYMDAFQIIAVFFLVCIPLVLLFRKDPGGGGPVLMH